MSKNVTLEGLKKSLVDAIVGGGMDDVLQTLLESSGSPPHFASAMFDVTKNMLSAVYIPTSAVYIPTSGDHATSVGPPPPDKPCARDTESNVPEKENRSQQVRREESPEPALAHINEFCGMKDPKLAQTLINWATTTDSDMPHEFKAKTGFSTLNYTRNKSINQMVACLCVHQYAWGSIGNMPPKDYGAFQMLKSDCRKETIYTRGLEMITFLTTHRKGWLQRIGVLEEELHSINLYNKLEHWKRAIKDQGLFDPEATSCTDSKNCSGAYWKHYQKINKVVDLHQKAIESKERWFLTEDSLREFRANTNRLYTTAKERRIERGRTKTITPETVASDSRGRAPKRKKTT